MKCQNVDLLLLVYIASMGAFVNLALSTVEACKCLVPEHCALSSNLLRMDTQEFMEQKSNFAEIGQPWDYGRTPAGYCIPESTRIGQLGIHADGTNVISIGENGEAYGHDFLVCTSRQFAESL